MVATLAIGAILVTALGGVIGRTLDARAAAKEKHALARDARFAMERMVRAVGSARRLILPLTDNPATNWPENLREETVPASPPVGDSTKATAVLAVTLSGTVDLDGDGTPDADDDGDGALDEDLPGDANLDLAPGIALVDDDGDGAVDEGVLPGDDDEDGAADEDPVNGVDDDGDGSVDEDPGGDVNADGCPGFCGADDDGDGGIDEGSLNAGDDDEAGGVDEDPWDTVVFHLAGGALVERTPVPWDEDGIAVPYGPVDGRDYRVEEIASNVTRFRVKRLPPGAGRATVVVLTLELTGPVTGATVALRTRVRVGSAL